MCYTYTEEEREDAMLGLDLELVIWGYLILEYSLSFNLFLCKVNDMTQGRFSLEGKILYKTVKDLNLVRIII